MPEVILLQPHTHAGKDVAPGEPLTVTELEADWLRENNLIAPAAADASTQSLSAGGRGKALKQDNDNAEA